MLAETLLGRTGWAGCPRKECCVLRKEESQFHPPGSLEAQGHQLAVHAGAEESAIAVPDFQQRHKAPHPPV